MATLALEAPRTGLDDAERSTIDQAIARHQGHPGELLGILQDVQNANRHKYLSLEALRYVAAETGIPAARVYSVATFYALFNLDPQGDNLVCVCRGTACHTRGSRDLLEKLCLDLGLSGSESSLSGSESSLSGSESSLSGSESRLTGAEQSDTHDADKLTLTTADRRFTVRTVACFGQCAMAPVVEINHHILSHVNERTLQREVKQLRQGRK